MKKNGKNTMNNLEKPEVKNYIKKDHKTQNQYASNQIINTIQEPAKNKSAFESRKKGY